MKRLVLGSVAVATLATAAIAAETTPVFEVLPPAEASPYNWTGFYGRLNTLTPTDTLMLGVPISGAPTDGFIGSAQFGYNYQSGAVVIGIEGDVTRRRGVEFIGSSGFEPLNAGNEQGWIGTLRSRAGLATDGWLFYSTGGLAYGSADADGRPAEVTGSSRIGWTVGAGVEYATGKQWSLGLEYLYADFGKSAQSQSGLAFSTPGTPEDRSQMVRGRLNYRFGWDGAVK